MSDQATVTVNEETVLQVVIEAVEYAAKFHKTKEWIAVTIWQDLQKESQK